MSKDLSRRQLNLDRDPQILIFLWQCKVATTNLIHLKFFHDRAMKTTYNRLYRLQQYGLIKKIRVDLFCAWSLDKKGFALIRGRLPSFKETAYTADHPLHDFLCTLILQAGVVQIPKEDIKTVSHQTLRCYAEEELENWVPNTKWILPDGYWRLQNKTAALEVEFRGQPKGELKERISDYRDCPQILRVLWVVPSRKYANRILKIGNQYFQGDREKFNFVLLKDIFNQLWSAKIIHGPEKDRTIYQFILEDHFGSQLGFDQKENDTLLLDLNLSPRKGGQIVKTLPHFYFEFWRD